MSKLVKLYFCLHCMINISNIATEYFSRLSDEESAQVIYNSKYKKLLLELQQRDTSSFFW